MTLATYDPKQYLIRVPEVVDGADLTRHARDLWFESPTLKKLQFPYFDLPSDLVEVQRPWRLVDPLNVYGSVTIRRENGEVEARYCGVERRGPWWVDEPAWFIYDGRVEMLPAGKQRQMFEVTNNSSPVVLVSGNRSFASGPTTGGMISHAGCSEVPLHPMGFPV